MSIEEKFQSAKLFYEQIQLPDNDEFKRRFFESLGHDRNPAPKRKVRKKLFVIGLSILALPVTAFAGIQVLLNGFGEQFSYSKHVTGPYSTAANPLYPANVLNAHGVDHFSLKQSRNIANFPIRVPNKVVGWTKVLSEGAEFPQNNDIVVNHQEQLVNVTKTPLEYIEIYTNKKGQRIAVTEQYDYDISAALRQLQGVLKAKIISSWTLGSNATPVGGFDNSLAFFVSGNWSDVPGNLPDKGNFSNLILLHQEVNDTVTRIVIDEYGDVDQSTLNSFAHSYLDSPSK